MRIVSIVATSGNDVQARALSNRLQFAGIATDADGRAIDDRTSACRLKHGDLLDGKVEIIQHKVVADGIRIASAPSALSALRARDCVAFPGHRQDQ